MDSRNTKPTLKELENELKNVQRLKEELRQTKEEYTEKLQKDLGSIFPLFISEFKTLPIPGSSLLGTLLSFSIEEMRKAFQPKVGDEPTEAECKVLAIETDLQKKITALKEQKAASYSFTHFKLPQKKSSFHQAEQHDSRDKRRYSI